MTREEIEKKADNAFPSSDKLGLVVSETTKLRREGYIKCAEEYESLPKIHGWVARDMGPLNALDLNIGKLKLWPKVPIRNNVGCFWMPNFPQNAAIMDLPEETMPELAWESEPVEVELLIRKV